MPAELLGRIEPPDWKHVERYPLTLARAAAVAPEDVVIGISWFEGFEADRLVKRGTKWYLPPPEKWGRELGGHAIGLQRHGALDSYSWYRYYWQRLGSCTCASVCRVQTLNNRRRYGFEGPMYETVQLNDEWADTPPKQGSSLRAAFDITRKLGLRPMVNGRERTWSHADGINENRWATSVEEILLALGAQDASTVPWLQTWGSSYPRRVHIDVDYLHKMIFERGGEAGIITDRPSGGS